MRARWLVPVIMLLCCPAIYAQAPEGGWQGVQSGNGTVIAPGLKLGKPTPLDAREVASLEQPTATAGCAVPAFRQVVRSQNPDPLIGMPPPPPPPPPGSLGMPPPPPPPPPGLVAGSQSANSEAYKCGEANRVARSGTGNFFTDAPAAIGGFFAPADGRALFQSDHKFDVFVSPVSNPFYFLDPRSLTEIKPLFIYQRTPNYPGDFSHSNIFFSGVQGSVALTDRLSLKFNELGFFDISYHDAQNDIFHNGSGFAALKLGPQYTIIRSEATCTLLAAGLSFDIPAGSSRVFQDHSSLSLRPYLSFGQNFATPIGVFNFLNTTGFSFGTDNKPSDFFYSSFHLDYDVAGWHTLFPLIELNYFYYAQNGHDQTVLNFEGRDLINFGSGAVSGQNNVSLALGARYKLSEMIQFGGVFEFPLNKPRELLDFRFTFDVIFRY